MDISNAIIAKSDQLNAIDLAGGSRNVTVTEVSKGTIEQPVNIVTDVFGDKRPFKPSKTVLRMLALAWGKETTAWVGRSMTIYREPSVKWGGEEIGGIRIKALSHIDAPMEFNLATAKGRTAKSIVQPLEDPAAWVTRINASDTIETLLQVWENATSAGVTRHKTVVDAKDARKKALTA